MYDKPNDNNNNSFTRLYNISCLIIFWYWFLKEKKKIRYEKKVPNIRIFIV
jgi:hypothetical protein